MDAMKDLDLATLKAICRSVLADEAGEQQHDEAEGKPDEQVQSDAKPKTASTFVFVGDADRAWPETKPGRRRPTRKEQTDA